MKRTVSIILSLTLIFSSFSLFAFTSNAQTPATDTATYALLDSITKSGELHVEGTLKDFKVGSRSLTVPFTVDAKGETVSIEAKVSFLNLRILYLNGKFYVMIPAFRIYSKVDMLGEFGIIVKNLLSRIWNESKYFSQDFYVGSTATGVSFNGGTYDMEEIVENTKNPSFNAKVYYNASKEIKGVYATSTTINMDFNVDVTSATADATDANLVFPVLYFDFSVIVMLIFGLLTNIK